MAWTINTATDFQHLLEQLKNFATGSCGWTVDEWDTAYDTGSEYKLIMHGPGSGADEIYVGARTYRSVGLDYYNWSLQGFTGYSALNDFDDQAGAISNTLKPGVKLWDSSIPYWFVGNGRRIMGVAKVSNTYQAFYLGWFLPYGLPTEFTYPLTVGGSYSGRDLTNAGRFSQSDYSGNYPDGYYNESSQASSMHVLTNDWNRFGGVEVTRCCWPWMSQDAGDTKSSEGSASNYRNENGFWYRLQKNFDGSYPMFPATLTYIDPFVSILGELEGVMAVPGWGLAPEDVISHDGDTYIVFPTSLDSPENWEFFAMKME